MKDSPPLIVTLELDAASHDYFTALRNQHYPKHCNYLEAHCTLFHRLPSGLPLINDLLQQASAREQFPLQINSINNTGNGVAYTIFSNELQTLHQSLKRSLRGYLISKDRNKLRPHITIQNKVTAFKADQTFATLAKDFIPLTAQGIGFKSWLYQKGYWQQQQFFPFFETGSI